MPNGQSSTADWRLRFGLVGTQGNSLIVRRGDSFGSVTHPAIEGRVLYDVLQNLGERFSYRDLLEAFRNMLPEKEALQVIGYLKNEAGIVAAPIPDVPKNEVLISDASGGFLTPSGYCQLELVLMVDSVDHSDELIRIVRAILGRPPQTTNVSVSLPIQADAVILCANGLNPQETRDVEGRLAQQDRPWFSVADFGGSARAGPFNSVRHKTSVCGRCLDGRIHAAGLPTSPGAVAVSRHFTMAAIFGIHQLVRLVATPNSEAVFGNLTYSISADLEIHRWRVAPMFGCATCGTIRSAASSPRAVRQKRVAGTYADSELRDFTWQTTLDRYRAHLGPLDVIQSVREVEHPSVAGIFTSAATVSTPGAVRDDLESRSFIGVGFDRGRAELASVARAVERLSLCQDGTELGVTSSAQEIGPDALAPNRWGPELAQYDRVMLRWTRAYSLFDGGHRLVPNRSVFYPYSPVKGEAHVPWGPHPSGTGCDLSHDAALLWALLELIEMDTMVRVDTYGLSGKVVDPSVFNADHQIAHLMQALLASGHRVVIRDCSLDLGIPVVAAVVVADESSKHVSRGTCAHPCGTYAVRHALREAVRRMFQPHDREPYCGHLLDASGGDRCVRLPDVSQGNVHDDLEHVLTLLRRVSSDIVAVDLAGSSSLGSRSPRDEIHCVRVLAPELIGPLSTPNSARLVVFDPGPHRISHSPVQPGLVVGRSATDAGPANDIHLPTLIEATSESLPALGDEHIVTLGQGVLAGLVNERLQSLGRHATSYSDTETLLLELDSGQARPDIVIAALGEVPASVVRVWNTEAFVRGVPWIAFTQRGDDVECGPLVRGAPHHGCYWCMRLHTYSKNTALAAWEQNNKLPPDSAGGIFHGGARLAVECLLGEVALFLSGKTPQELKVRRFGLNEDVSEERYSAVTECAVCGTLADRPIPQ